MNCRVKRSPQVVGPPGRSHFRYGKAFGMLRLATRFSDYLASLKDIEQFIVIENKDPPSDTAEAVPIEDSRSDRRS